MKIRFSFFRPFFLHLQHALVDLKLSVDGDAGHSWEGQQVTSSQLVFHWWLLPQAGQLSSSFDHPDIRSHSVFVLGVFIVQEEARQHLEGSKGQVRHLII